MWCLELHWRAALLLVSQGLSWAVPWLVLVGQEPLEWHWSLIHGIPLLVLHSTFQLLLEMDTNSDVFLEFPAGGCLLAMKEVEEVIMSEESQSADNLAATVLSEDPHTVLVEFSSVVADTQEYIIEVRRGSQPAHWELSTGFGQEKLCSCSRSCSRLLGEGKTGSALPAQPQESVGSALFGRRALGASPPSQSAVCARGLSLGTSDHTRF